MVALVDGGLAMADATGLIAMFWTPDGGSAIPVAGDLDSVQCWIETKDLDFGREDLTKFIQKLYAKIEEIESATSLRFIIKYRDHLGQALSEEAAVPFGGVNAVAIRPPGAKYFRIRIDDPSIQVRWRLSELELFGALGGRRF
jgi:hypothetical protein